MQTFNVVASSAATNANNIKNVFDEHVTGYFSSVERSTNGEWEDVDFYMQGLNSPVMKMRVSSAGSTQHRLTVGSYSITCSGGSSDGYRFAQITVTDNAIAIRCDNTSNTSSCKYFLICKNDAGDPMVIAPISDGWSTLYQLKADMNRYGEWKIYDLKSASQWTFYHYKRHNTSGYVTGVPAVHPTGGGTKNVWIPVETCYDSILEPFTYTINGESYVGIGFNNFIIKST